jgi:hypothetical protein
LDRTARPSPPHRVRDGGDGLVLADDAPVQPLLHLEQLLDLALDEPADRDAGPPADDVGDVVGVDLLLQHLAGGLERRERRLAIFQVGLELDELAVLELGRAVVVEGALGLLDLVAGPLDAVLELGDGLDRVALLLPPGAELVALLLELGDRPLDGSRRARDASSFSLRSASRSIWSCIIRRSTSSSSTGSEVISIRSFEAASSTRSIALSGRKRSAM